MVVLHFVPRPPPVPEHRTQDLRGKSMRDKGKETTTKTARQLYVCSINPAQESASHGDLPVIENSEPPQGARVLTDEQSRLTPTDANG